MLESMQKAFKIGDLRTKLLFTLMMLLVFRLGAHIPVPNINADAIQQFLTGQLFSFFDVVSGGAFRKVCGI
jgi:preprotein translocase subunit SecY